MQFRNHTHCPALAYQAIDQHGSTYHVVTLRQTLALRHGAVLDFAPEQAPLVIEDDYFGEPNRSSVRQESDIAPFKPRCDVVVVATAHAPGRYPAPRFPVGIRITCGNKVVLDRTLTVTGPRFWDKPSIFNSWWLTPPEPALTVPLRYEYAFGGELKAPDEAGRRRAAREGKDPEAVPPLNHTVVETNPVGRGYAEEWYLRATWANRIPAPQIEDPAEPVTTFGARYPARGFGVVGRAWLPRRALAGTVDEAFIKSDRWLPPDFDFAYWNGAHPDLQVPYLRGDETVELTHLTPDGRCKFRLPGHRPYVLVRYADGELEPRLMNLDTLVIDVEAGTVAEVYRLTLPVRPAVRVLEARRISYGDWEEFRNWAVPLLLVNECSGPVPGTRPTPATAEVAHG